MARMGNLSVASTIYRSRPGAGNFSRITTPSAHRREEARGWSSRGPLAGQIASQYWAVASVMSPQPRASHGHAVSTIDGECEDLVPLGLTRRSCLLGLV